LPGEAQTTLADITKASALGWKPKTDLETGLIHAVHYIKSEMAGGRICAAGK
jgi:nucleoside-diphosphate-sugar epimerase